MFKVSVLFSSFQYACHHLAKRNRLFLLPSEYLQNKKVIFFLNINCFRMIVMWQHYTKLNCKIFSIWISVISGAYDSQAVKFTFVLLTSWRTCEYEICWRICLQMFYCIALLLAQESLAFLVHICLSNLIVHSFILSVGALKLFSVGWIHWGGEE